MTEKKFLNVEYSVYKTRIHVTSMYELSEVQIAVKEALSIEVGYDLIQLAPENILLQTWMKLLLKIHLNTTRNWTKLGLAFLLAPRLHLQAITLLICSHLVKSLSTMI